jgi:ABC-2 type transport system ATP-binding protein
MTEPVIAARHLCKRFGSKRVLDDVTVSAGQGDVVGVLGRNGAGKTTLLEILLGLSPPTSGEAIAFDAPGMELSESNKKRVGYVPQRDEMLEIVTGKQQIQIVSSFHDHWDKPLVDRLVAEWSIPIGTRIGRMSGGERHKLSVVLALAHHPELLILDEPVASLDPIARRDFLRQLLDIADMAGRCVIFSSHIVSDLERAANKLWILKEGRLVWAGELDSLKERVVRLHVRADRTLTQPADWPGLLSSRIDGARGVFTVENWSASEERRIAALFSAPVESEPLGLEEIFVELHR